ncbi:MAG: hypothetical protein U9N38_00080 [Thermodesulfobacteriota bacterium]|nr:hypothetical protein [Thermodesulfobacteriota bacterium]
MLRNIYYVFTILFAIALICCFEGCYTYPEFGPVQKEGKWYGKIKGFKCEWWQYYEAALSYADGSCWKEAEVYLREAIRQKKGDYWRVNTYGYHYTDYGYSFKGYFPHRELGIVLFEQGKLDGALKQLEISLNLNEPSDLTDRKRPSDLTAKAQIYLNRVRKSLIKRDKSDTLPPEITGLCCNHGSLTRNFSVVISGMAKDDTFISKITIEGKAFRIDVSNKEIPFSMEVPVKPGENNISVRVVDLAGKDSSSFFTVTVDCNAPNIRIETPFAGDALPEGGGPLMIHCSDDCGLAELIINNEEPIKLDKSKKQCIKKTVHLKPEKKELIIMARDLAGNKNIAQICLSKGPLPPKGMQPCPDRSLPVITLREKNRATYEDRAYIDGKVTDDQAVESLFIRENLNNEKQILKTSGTNVFFNYIVGLNEGTNSITLRAQDNSGKDSQSKTIWIERHVLNVRDVGSRLSIAVYPFDRGIISGGPARFSRNIEDCLMSALGEPHSVCGLKERCRFSNIFWRKSHIKKRGDEVGALKKERSAGADAVLFGWIEERKNSMVIRCRIDDTETFKTIAGMSVFGDNLEKDKHVLAAMIQGLDIKLRDNLPLVEAKVVKIQGENIFVDMGKNKRVKENMKLIVYKVEKADEHYTGSTGHAGISGQARIRDVGKTISVAEITRVKNGMVIKPGHSVITR